MKKILATAAGALVLGAATSKVVEVAWDAARNYMLKKEDMKIPKTKNKVKPVKPQPSMEEVVRYYNFKKKHKLFEADAMSRDRLTKSGLPEYVQRYDLFNILRARVGFAYELTKSMEDEITVFEHEDLTYTNPYSIAMLYHQLIAILELLDVDFVKFYIENKFEDLDPFAQMIKIIKYLDQLEIPDPVPKMIDGKPKYQLDLLVIGYYGALMESHLGVYRDKFGFRPDKKSDVVKSAVHFLQQTQPADLMKHRIDSFLSMLVWFQCVLFIESGEFKDDASLKRYARIQADALNAHNVFKGNEVLKFGFEERLVIVPDPKRLLFYMKPCAWEITFRKWSHIDSKQPPYHIIDNDGIEIEMWT